MSRRVARLARVLALAGAFACGGQTHRVTEPAHREPAIAEIHAHRCGRCHTPPEPGSHTRAQLIDAFSRHRNRVRLSSDEWEAMVRYLAPPESAAIQRR